jgi:protein-tyrosine phosphatase
MRVMRVGNSFAALWSSRKTWLSAFALSCGWQGAQAVLPLAGETVSVERRSPTEVIIDWQGLGVGKSVSVFIADAPNAKRDARRRLIRDDRDGHEVLTIAKTKRAYFWIKPRGGKGQWAAERLLPLEGGINFRDLGGYAAKDRRTVRWGTLYRSANMAGLTAGDYAYLGALGIRSVCDFRTTSERASGPNAWVKDAGLKYWTRDYAMSGGNLASMLGGGKLTAEGARAAMANLYRAFPAEQAPAYREMFAQLVSGKLPLAFNCTAGKDRTGLGAALILTALGVPYEVVKTDYLLSNRYLSADAIKADKGLSMIAKMLPPDVAAPLLGVESDYLDTAFDVIKAKHGSVEAYLATELGVGAPELRILKRRLLE